MSFIMGPLFDSSVAKGSERSEIVEYFGKLHQLKKKIAPISEEFFLERRKKSDTAKVDSGQLSWVRFRAAEEKNQ